MATKFKFRTPDIIQLFPKYEEGDISINSRFKMWSDKNWPPDGFDIQPKVNQERLKHKDPHPCEYDMDEDPRLIEGGDYEHIYDLVKEKLLEVAKRNRAIEVWTPLEKKEYNVAEVEQYISHAEELEAERERLSAMLRDAGIDPEQALPEGVPTGDGGNDDGGNDDAEEAIDDKPAAKKDGKKKKK